MAAEATMTIRKMLPTDLAAGLHLSGAAGWNQTAADWERLLSWQPEGCFVADEGGEVAGTVTTTTYGPDLAWVGMLLVDERRRRRGIARRLLARALAGLAEAGVRTVGLDATPLGKPLYDQTGFGDWFSVDRWEGIAPGKSSSAVGGTAVGPLTGDDLVMLGQGLDRAAVGVQRGPLLQLLADAPGALASATGPRGAPTGYVLVRPGARRWHVGPLVARHAADAEALLDAALGPLAGQPVVLDVPRPNLAACRLVEARGFAIVRSFSRMLRGDPPTVDLGTLFATGGPELG